MGVLDGVLGLHSRLTQRYKSPHRYRSVSYIPAQRHRPSDTLRQPFRPVGARALGFQLPLACCLTVLYTALHLLVIFSFITRNPVRRWRLVQPSYSIERLSLSSTETFALDGYQPLYESTASSPPSTTASPAMTDLFPHDIKNLIASFLRGRQLKRLVLVNHAWKAAGEPYLLSRLQIPPGHRYTVDGQKEAASWAGLRQLLESQPSRARSIRKMSVIIIPGQSRT